MRKTFFLYFLLLFFFTTASPAVANNLVISNVTLEDRNASANTMVVQFDIAWDHSWRKADGRHDAAWVFIKILDSSTAPWVHGVLYTAGTNPTNTSPGTNSDVKIVIPTDKTGAFISRQATGNGTFSSRKVRLTVDYGTSGIADTDTIQVQVHGIEMVYVPEGPFYVGEANNPYSGETPSAIQGGYDNAISVFNSSGVYQWSKRLGGTYISYFSEFVDVASNSNNFIVAATDDNTVDLNGDGDASDTNETQSGLYSSSDILISVFNSAGTFQWSERLGGTNADSGYGVAAGANNNIAVIGQVYLAADLNGDADTADTNEGTGGVYSNFDAFISVFNSAGTFQWSERLGGTAADIAYSVAVNSSSSIIVTGYVTGNADLSGDADTADTNESTGGVYSGTDIFISVFNSAGTFQWSERLGGTAADVGYSVRVSSNNNVVVGGHVTGNADLNGDGDTADSNETAGGVYGQTDGFISVFNSAGTFQWSERLGGSAGFFGDSITGLATDSNNNIIAAGKIEGNVDLNGDADTADTNEAGGGIYEGLGDAFISVFNSAGTFQWSERLGGTGLDNSQTVTVDSNNNVIVAGVVANAADLNGDADTADTNEATGGVYTGSNVFISVFNSGGTFQWSERLGGTGGGYYVGGIATDSSNNIVVGARIDGNTDLNGDAAITATNSLYQPGALNAAAQITTTGTSVTTYLNSNDDIDTSATTVTGLAGITGNTSWPNGYDDFYVMKYEITQQQYVNFLNDLTRVQQGTRVGATVSGNTIANYYVMSNGTTVSARNGIRAPASGNGTSPTAVVFGNDFNANGTFNETDDGQTIAANWLNWPDVVAYADWAGLRPMTELEFEKVAHGPNSPTYGEFAWGNTAITQASSIVNPGRGSEVSGNAAVGLAVYGSHASVQGPLRAGFAATNATNRFSAGNGYYGSMELSGNVAERAVTLGNSTGRAFTGTHGDGTLTSTASYEGNATNNDWPGIDATTARGVTAGTGAGWRGGNWNDSTVSATNLSQPAWIADRNTATGGVVTRDNEGGGRLVRTSP